MEQEARTKGVYSGAVSSMEVNHKHEHTFAAKPTDHIAHIFEVLSEFGALGLPAPGGSGDAQVDEVHPPYSTAKQQAFLLLNNREAFFGGAVARYKLGPSYGGPPIR